MKKHKLLKKIVALLVVMTITCNLFTAHAHTGEYHAGGYYDDKQANLKFLIMDSALTSILTMDVYNSATSWNGISDNVYVVSVVKHVYGMPTSGFNCVYGQAYTDGTLGTTTFYGVNGNAVSANATWNSVMITMNSDAFVFALAPNATNAAKKTFTHEVGHALKLKHPENGSFSGHTQLGYPYAVMNQGLYGTESYLSMVPSIHDKSNLIDKWN